MDSKLAANLYLELTKRHLAQHKEDPISDNILKGMSVITKIPDARLKLFDTVFKKDGLVVPVPFEFLRRMTTNERGYYCYINGMYGIANNELILFIRSLIGNRTAIEIGAGLGTFGRALGIPITDSRIQERPDIIEYYRKCKTPTIQYPDDVEKLTALDAVKKYKPQVVFGSWITHRFNNKYPERAGNPEGARTHLFFKHGVKSYIMLGNEVTHKSNPLFKDSSIRHAVMDLPFILSRTQRTGTDRLFIFEKK